MNPLNASAVLPSRPRFSWDLKNVPWTDGKGSQEEYAEAVRLWSALHDKLPDSSSNKIGSDIRGIMLKSQFYGRAKEIVKKVPDDVIESNEGAQAIVNAVYKRDALSTVSDVYQDFMRLMNLKRGPTETFLNFESRFEAQISKFNAHSETSKIPASLTALMLLANSKVDSGQRISVLAAAAPSSDSNAKTTDDYLKEISYDSVASVLRQCDRTGNGDQNVSSSALHANSVSATTFNTHRKKKGKKKLNPAELADLKTKTECRICHKHGHWACDHHADGTVKPGAVVIDTEANRNNQDENPPRRRNLTFNMASLDHGVPNSKIPHDFIGPLVDDGAPYSGMGMHEFTLLKPVLLAEWNGQLDPIPASIADRPYWQYGVGSHASAPRRILGSVLLSVESDNGHTVAIRHLVISGTSQWVIGRNVTRSCDINHIGGNKLVLPDHDDSAQHDSLSMVDSDFHSYIPYERFLCPTVQASSESVVCTVFCATAQIEDGLSKRPWKEIQTVVDKVHKHVCGHSNFSDLKFLLQRNSLRNDEISKYLSRVLERCGACATTSEPKQERKVTISSMSRSFNVVVCIDHLHLDGIRVFHMMDSATRYSTGAVVQSTAMPEAIMQFEAQWVSPF